MAITPIGTNLAAWHAVKNKSETPLNLHLLILRQIPKKIIYLQRIQLLYSSSSNSVTFGNFLCFFDLLKK